MMHMHGYMWCSDRNKRFELVVFFLVVSSTTLRTYVSLESISAWFSPPPPFSHHSYHQFPFTNCAPAICLPETSSEGSSIRWVNSHCIRLSLPDNSEGSSIRWVNSHCIRLSLSDTSSKGSSIRQVNSHCKRFWVELTKSEWWMMLSGLLNRRSQIQILNGQSCLIWFMPFVIWKLHRGEYSW